MSTYSDSMFDLRTTTIKGITLPLKRCGDIEFNFWSYVVDDMVEHIRYLREDFVVRNTDVFICTFPRSGTNWTNELVTMVLQGSSEFAPLLAAVENLTKEQLEKMESPRVLCTHLPLRFLPPKITETAKMICVFRNPKDVAVSLHNYMLNVNFVEYNATWNDYIQQFLDGDVPCSKWFDHVLDWERIIDEDKSASILTLKYEDMKSHLQENVKRIADFLGVHLSPDLMTTITNQCQFQTQYKERTTNVHDIVAKLTKNIPNFLYRKGEVGDWKNWFTVAQNEQFDKIYTERMKESKTSTIRGIQLPIKPCGNVDLKLWSYDVDDMEEHIRYLREDFVVRDTDVFICTFPRSGTNWTHEIIQMLVNGTTDFAPLFAFAEGLASDGLEKLASPRIICSHLPYQYLPPKITEIAKIVLVFRNPKDIAVSLHNYLLHINFVDYTATWNEFLQLFLDGEVPCGKWFDHVLEWERVEEEYKSASIMKLYYEDMKSNLLESTKKIADFLGLHVTPELMKQIASKCGFQKQYKERTTNVHEIIAKLTKNAPNFLYRKGEVGDWKNWFTVAQSKQFDKMYDERMTDSKLKIKFSL